jgi:hypothetical protein
MAKRTEKLKPIFFVKIRYGQDNALANWSIPAGYPTFQDTLEAVNALIRTHIKQVDYLDVRIGNVPRIKL